MKKRLAYLVAALLWSFIPLSCFVEESDPHVPESLPDGTPVTIKIGFGIPDLLDVSIKTKAEASRADEARVHDLYVMLFDTDSQSATYKQKIYGRYFTYEHQIMSLSALDTNPNEGWYVENGDNSRGVVKIATETRSSCKLVMLANVANTITSINHTDPIDCFAQINDLDELLDVRVTLEQEIVNRADLFLMMGYADGVNTGTLSWGSFDNSEPVYTLVGANNDEYQLPLKTIDAKIKFCIKFDTNFIDVDKTTVRNWWAFNLPAECYLFPKGSNPSDINYFDTQSSFFEGEETINGEKWEVFSFYMLENRQAALQSIENPSPRPENYVPDYYLREKETDASLEEANFIYAPAKGTYVKFNIMLGLKPSAFAVFDNSGANHALTSEAMFTVHLGDFTDSNAGTGSRGHDYDNYTVERSTAYRYFITIKNSTSIYAEVMGEDHIANNGDEVEKQPGQEGSMMLSTDEIIECDAHYAYHCMTFTYNKYLTEKNVSWYIKTPFDEGGAQYNSQTGDWSEACQDYLWVKFGINIIENGTYSLKRASYPGDNMYKPNWDTDGSLKDDPNTLLNIHQLFKYIMHQTRLRKAWVEGGSVGDDPSDFIEEDSGIEDNPSTLDIDESKRYVIRVTAFIDEYYYEKDPTLGPDAPTDPELWREFVNKDPRELHILSDSNFSADGQSDVITSSHSIIQKSIQTFYNTYSPDLRSLWGTEHVDEMEYKARHEKDPSQTAWAWWPNGRAVPNSASTNSDENGRANSAAMWGVKDHPQWDASTAPIWEDYHDDDTGTDYTGMLDYSVENEHPELKSDYKYLAYSCLTRNRDNNGNHRIDPEEVRWYTASVNQLIGMWVGNESLSPSARIYQPVNKNDTEDGRNWRAWVISSTASSIADPRVIRAEEGASKSQHSTFDWTSSPKFTAEDRDKVSSVRCVRNIGTFNNGGVVTDISEAPLSQMVDQYYDSPAGFDANNKVLPNADGTYTLKFSRLDPRSLREYTSVDLPYHEEYSMHNRVYMELNMQNPTDPVVINNSPKETEDQINDAITNLGHNTYCPAGYRLPNMTEMVMMVAHQPSSYWGGSAEFPCRTYYSRGVRGSKTTPEENYKIGWGYRSGQSKFNMFNYSGYKSPTYITGLRCVRDNNCTGAITGTISVPNGDKLHVGEEFTIKLNFSSMGSAINTVNLSLIYVSTSGSEESWPIPTTGLKLSGVSLQDAEVKWAIPEGIELLGNMFIRAEVFNNAGMRYLVETPVTVVSPVFASVRLLPVQYQDADNPSFPIMLTASQTMASNESKYNLSSWNLTVTDPDGEKMHIYKTQSTLVPTGDNRHWTCVFPYTYTMSSLIPGTYTFQLEVITAGGTHTRSQTAKMDVLMVDYRFNRGMTGVEYNQASDVTYTWEPTKVENLSMSGGDFIEANMDLTNCYYLPVYDANQEFDKNATIGRDNLISIGITDTDHGLTTTPTVPDVYHVYYPAHDGDVDSGKDWVRTNISTGAKASNGTNYRWFIGGPGTGLEQQGTYQSIAMYKPDISARQQFRIDRNGAFWNNQLVDTAKWSLNNNEGNPTEAAASLARIQSSDVLYVGATFGPHKTRARYCFVRVVRNSALSNAAGGHVTFDDDPVNGGDL